MIIINMLSGKHSSAPNFFLFIDEITTSPRISSKTTCRGISSMGGRKIVSENIGGIKPVPVMFAENAYPEIGPYRPPVFIFYRDLEASLATGREDIFAGLDIHGLRRRTCGRR